MVAAADSSAAVDGGGALSISLRVCVRNHFSLVATELLVCRSDDVARPIEALSAEAPAQARAHDAAGRDGAKEASNSDRHQGGRPLPVRSRGVANAMRERDWDRIGTAEL